MLAQEAATIRSVGSEGLVGISLFMGGETTPNRCVVQSAGEGFRMRSQVLKDEFNRSGSVLPILLRYTQALITQFTAEAPTRAQSHRLRQSYVDSVTLQPLTGRPATAAMPTAEHFRSCSRPCQAA